MPNQFTPDADDQMPEKKSSQQRLLLLLLLLAGLFAYLYFFTGLIKPREEQPIPQPVAEAPVKQPLPPRPQAAAPAAPGAVVTAGTQAPKGSAPPVQQAKPAQPAAPASAAPAAKPAPAAQAKAEKPAPPAASAPQAKGAKPAAAAKAARPAAPAAPKLAAKPAAEAKAGKTAVAKPVKAKAVAKSATAAYALEINGDLAESEMGSVTAKLKQAGIAYVVKTKSQKGELMHRLFLADFGSRDAAVEELERLKVTAPDAFMLKEDGRFAVYAGSYLREGKAAVEQDRLFDKGVKLLLKNATIPVSVVKVRAGSFADQASAEKAAHKLKKSGLSAKVVKAGK